MIFEAVYNNGKAVRCYYSKDYSFYEAWERFAEKAVEYGRNNGLRLISMGSVVTNNA